MNRRNLFRLAAAGAVAAFQDDAIRRVSAAATATKGRTPEDIAADEDFWAEVRTSFTVACVEAIRRGATVESLLAS